MLENFLGNAALNFVTNHQDYIVGAVAGAILTHPGTCAVLVFNAAVKIPGVGYWISKHPEEAKAWADQFDKAIDSAVDKYAKDQTPLTPPNPTPGATS